MRNDGADGEQVGDALTFVFVISSIKHVYTQRPPGCCAAGAPRTSSRYNFITRTSHYESFTMRGTGYNVRIARRGRRAARGRRRARPRPPRRPGARPSALGLGRASRPWCHSAAPRSRPYEGLVLIRITATGFGLEQNPRMENLSRESGTETPNRIVVPRQPRADASGHPQSDDHAARKPSDGPGPPGLRVFHSESVSDGASVCAGHLADKIDGFRPGQSPATSPANSPGNRR